MLNLQFLDPALKKVIDEGKISVIIAKIKNVSEEPINLKTNRNMVSFTEKSFINKVEVQDILMAFGFENGRLRFDDYSLRFSDTQFDSKSDMSDDDDL